MWLDFRLCLFFSVLAQFMWLSPVEAKCVEKYISPVVAERSEVYAKTPYKGGERAQYEVKYLGILVGYGDLSVLPARKVNKLWSQVLGADGKTGDWYSTLFVAHDKIEAISNPVNQEATHFFIEQDEGKMFGRRLQRKKWIQFSQEDCTVVEKLEDKNKKRDDESYELIPGTMDVLTGAFYLRTPDYKIGQIVTAPIYTSEKNWQLRAEPLVKEKITVPAGSFETIKLKLTTYLGADLQQKGDIYVWVATDRPERPLVKIEGDIKLGHVEILLKEFTPGRG